MQPNPYEAYRLAQTRMSDAHREAERWRLVKSVDGYRGAPGLLTRLGLRRRRVVLVRPGGTAGKEHTSPRRAAPSATR